MKKVLVLDDSLTTCLMLKSWLVKKGYSVETATSVEEAKQMVKESMFDLILSDIRMPDTDGLSFLSWVKKYDSDILVIMMTGFADIETAVESMKSGAADYIPKPIEPELLFQKIEEAFKVQAKQKESKDFFSTFLELPTPQYKELLKGIDVLAESRKHFLLLGGRGTGKASIARYVYEKSVGNLKPYVVLDVEQFPASSLRALESDLTTVLLQKMEKAKGGVLYVSKVHKLDTLAQDKLLSLITKQEKGEDFTQIIISSEKSKEELGKSLLPKLYQTIEKEYVILPSLKGNKSVISFFTDYFLQFANSELDKNITTIEPEVQKQLVKYDWPGNIQELKNTIIKAVLLNEGNHIKAESLPLFFKGYQQESDQKPKLSVKGLRKENYEKEKIKEALELARGNKTMAASILNIDRKTLYNKIKQYKVEYPSS